MSGTPHHPPPRRPSDDDDELQEDAARSLVELGSAITGSVAGAGIGLVLGGPPGAIAGAAAGPAVSHVLHDFARRHLSERERVRVGAVVQYTTQFIRAGADAGRDVRNDGFFQTRGRDRPGAEEVAEGVLQAAQHEYEERKVEFLGRLLAEIVFRPEIDVATANLYVRTAREISYRQLLILALLAQKAAFPLPEGNYKDRGLTHDDPIIPLLHETMDLFGRRLIALPGSYILGILDIEPATLIVNSTRR